MRLTLLLVGLVLLGGAAAQGEGRDSFSLVGHFDGRSSFWTLEGDERRNPDLVVPPNATIDVRLLNDGTQVHNLQVEGHPASAYVSSDDPESTYTFRSPAAGTLDYWCQPHKAGGMMGRVVVAGSEADARDTPGASFALVLCALALLARSLRKG